MKVGATLSCGGRRVQQLVGPFVSGVRKQRAVNAGTLLAFPFYLVQDPSPQSG